MINRYRYTDKEKEELIKSIVILVDTRERKAEHITNYFDSKNIQWENKKLDYGDYSFYIKKNEKLGIQRDIYFTKEIMIERKANLEELSGNFSKDRSRIEKELCLSPKHKVLIIENANYHDIALGNYETKYNKKSFLATIHSFWIRYNIPFIFMPEKRFTGLFIREYFEYYLKNKLN